MNSGPKRGGNHPKNVQNAIFVGMCAKFAIRPLTLVYKLRVQSQMVEAFMTRASLRWAVQQRSHSTPVSNMNVRTHWQIFH